MEMDYLNKLIFASMLSISVFNLSNNRNLDLNFAGFNLNSFSYNISSSNYNNNNNLEKRFAFIESNYQGERRPIVDKSKLDDKLTKFTLNKIHPNYDAPLVVEEFYGQGLSRTSRIKEVIKREPLEGYFQDSLYYIEGDLVYIKRKAYMLTKNKEIIEGELDLTDGTSIITNSNQRYEIDVDNKGFMTYKLIE